MLIDDLELSLHDIRYREYRIDALHLKGHDIRYDFTPAADADLALSLQSNIADLNATAKLTGGDYTFDADLRPREAYLRTQLRSSGITLSRSPMLRLHAEGDLHRVDYDLTIDDLRIAQQGLRIAADESVARGYYLIPTHHLDLDADLRLRTTVADTNTTLHADLDLQDINRTLRYRAVAKISGAKPALGQLLGDANLTFTEASRIRLTAEGDMQTADVNMTLTGGQIGYGAYRITPQSVHLESRYDLTSRKLLTKGEGNVTSDMGDTWLRFDAFARLDDPLHTLRMTLDADIAPQNAFLAQLAGERNVTVTTPLRLALHARTVDRNITATLHSTPAELIVDGRKVRLHKLLNRLHYLPASEHLEGHLDLDADAAFADAKIAADYGMRLDDINGTLHYAAKAGLLQREAFGDINLTQLGRIALDINGSLKRFDGALRSRKLHATLRSDDFDRFAFRLDSGRLWLDRLYGALPPEFHKSEAALEASGAYRISDRRGEIGMRLKRLRYAGRTIRTNRFRFTVDGDDFALSPLQIEAKGFRLAIEAGRKDGLLQAKIRNRAFHGDLKYRAAPLYADALLDIPDIDTVLREIDRVYPLGKVPKIKGPLQLRAKMAGEQRVKVRLASGKIAFDAGRIENLAATAYYRPDRVDIPQLRFDLKGFKPKKMNRHVTLVHPGYLIFEGEGFRADLTLRNLLTLKAESRDGVTTASLRTNRLFLAYPGYGQTRLTTKVDLYRSGEQTALSGDVILEDTEIVYESRALDVSQDPDIIIVKDRRKKRQSDDDFIKNTFLDLHIRSKDEITYKVEAGTILFRPDVEVRKDFGAKLKLLGKVNVLEGEYDWGDKRFKIKEGAIAFRGLEEVNPHLDLHVEYDIDDVVISIDILGDKRKPKLVFKSKPTMSKKDIFSYLLFGFAVSESEGAQSSAANAAEKIFGRALAKDLARELHLDRLDLTRNRLGGIDIKAGKKVNKKTIVYYQNRNQESSVIVERKLNRHLDLAVEAGAGYQSAGLIYRKGYK